MQSRLEREAASREILQVISASRTDPAPVFDVILKNAAHLSGAPFANLCLVNEERSHWHLVAHFGDGLRHLAVGEAPRRLDSDLVPGVAIRTADVVHIEDLTETDMYKRGDPGRVAMVEEEGMRTIVGVPLISGDEAIGCITLFRREVSPFTDEEIQLVETFAAQAVIAIENVRQFREVQTRLERETATKNILRVISQSRDDDVPVFNEILKSASELCRAPLAFLSLANAERTHVTIPAYRGTRSEFGNILDGFEEPITRTELVAVRPVAEGHVLRADDITDDDVYRSGDIRRIQMADVEGARSVMSVPLLRDGVSLGAIVLYRRVVAPFSDDDVALVQSFAAQAVIAIENVRQFREVETRLEREAATKDVLHVISQSRDDEMPVFDVILKQAERLCHADTSGLQMVTENGQHLQMVLASGQDRGSFQPGHLFEISEPLNMCVAARERRVVHGEDLKNDDLYRQGHPGRRALVDDEGVLTQLAVPLIQGETVIGTMTLSRLQQKPFSADEIALVETFAAQAVIAIENVRQFKALETLNAELGDRVEAQVGELERMGKLKRFLPEQVADAVVSSGDDSMLSSHRALISALFCDIRGFTAFCETAEPEETIEVLQAYHEELGKLIADHGAGVDHRAGDGIMVLFNDPLPCDDPAGDAVQLAFAMRATMEGLCKRWRKLGHRLGFGVGISLGYATVGMVGSEGRFHYTASGTAVNLAARLCDMADDGEILLSPRAQIAVEDEVDTERMGEVEIKGISAPVEVWRALGNKG